MKKILLTTIFIIVSLGTTHAAYAITFGKPTCEQGKKLAQIPFILGGVRYNVPSELDPAAAVSVGDDAKGVLLPKGRYCVRKDAPDIIDVEPYRIIYLTIQQLIWKDYGDKYVPWPAQLMMDAHDKASYNPVADFCKEKKKLQGSNSRWEVYKEDPNFMLVTETVQAPNRPPVDVHYLYSEKYRFWGLPALLRCYNLDPEKSTIASPDCGHVWLVSDSTSIHIRFSLLNTPVTKIGEMLKGMEHFIESISVNPMPKVKFTSCEASSSKGE